MAYLIWLGLPISPAEIGPLLRVLEEIDLSHWGRQELWTQMQRDFFSSTPNWYQHLPRFLDRAREKSLHCALFGRSQYPQGFYDLRSPPPVITWIGSNQWQWGGHLAIVGSREISDESRQWLEFFLPQVLNRFPLMLLSGGARGTDQVAHGICLRAGGLTACFLPSGLDNPYPQSIQGWIQPMVEAGGAIVSPFAPWKGMQKHHFHLRNHLIANLSGVVLAVDGRRRSGTMITARAALEQGRAVAILPQHPIHSQGLGGLDLLFDGATPLRDDIDLEALCQMYVRKVWSTEKSDG